MAFKALHHVEVGWAGVQTDGMGEALFAAFGFTESAKSKTRDMSEAGFPIAKRYRLNTDSTITYVMRDAKRIDRLAYLSADGTIFKDFNGAYKNTIITAPPRNTPLSNKIEMYEFSV